MKKYTTDYDLLCLQLKAFAEDEPYCMPLLSNASAVINENLQGINWAGFYLMRGGRLVLGPFQGKPACIHIEPGKGVCGTAVSSGESQLVVDVHQFPGHIACDAASNSEVVIPLRQNGEIFGVLDIDSPEIGRFDEEDLAGLTAAARIIEETITFE